VSGAGDRDGRSRDERGQARLRPIGCPTCAAVAPPDGFRAISVENVTFTYPEATRPALEDVSLTIRGEIVALVGENGSGKTALAKLLFHLYRSQRRGDRSPLAGALLTDVLAL